MLAERFEDDRGRPSGRSIQVDQLQHGETCQPGRPRVALIES